MWPHGQAIDHDVEWLGLTPGKDFERMVDLSVIFRQRVPAVLGKASDPSMAKKVCELFEETGKKPVLVNQDIPGFLAKKSLQIGDSFQTPLGTSSPPVCQFFSWTPASEYIFLISTTSFS